LSKIAAGEAHAILRMLLERHPELCAEADALAAGLVTDVDPNDVADTVRDAILSLDLDDLGGRAGRHSWGYTEPTEAAWELLQEAMDPFLDDLKKHIALGFEVSAVATCKGIVLGLYAVRGKNSDEVLGWAPDFPAESAGEAIATLATESAKRHGHRWSLPDDFVAAVPEWAEMAQRASRK
jgi:hypothetical protein